MFFLKSHRALIIWIRTQLVKGVLEDCISFRALKDTKPTAHPSPGTHSPGDLEHLSRLPAMTAQPRHEGGSHRTCWDI